MPCVHQVVGIQHFCAPYQIVVSYKAYQRGRKPKSGSMCDVQKAVEVSVHIHANVLNVEADAASHGSIEL